MNNDAIWQAKHWGLGIGALMSMSGLIMAAPGNMQTWKKYESTDKFLGFDYNKSAIVRVSEPIPAGYKLVGYIRGNHEFKGLGATMMILGSTLLFGCATALKPEYERIERYNHLVRQSEFDLKDYEYRQEVEVERWDIDINAQKRISQKLQPPKSYYPPEDSDQPKLKGEPEFSRTATGFLAWLQQKAESKGNSFEVRWCCQQSFSGKKPTKEEVTTWITELIQIEQAEWLDEEKKNFRLLND